MVTNWLKGKVLRGEREGARIGFPTANLPPSTIPDETPRGVWASLVKYNRLEYKGALYYGPRIIKNEHTDVLEIHILDFRENIYGDIIEFALVKHISETQDFESKLEMKKKLQKDIMFIHNLLR